jgi:hypothetical protein
MYSFNEILENQKKFQKLKRPGNHFKHLFFSKSKKNGDYYAWWDFNNEEVKIIKYEKR